MDRPAHPRLLWPVLLVAAAVGLALRITAATGGLWLDEAWSAAFARDVATPVGVFVGIHHDNNHHLNTLWLQLVGFDAPSLLQRALSIAAGTATIVVAGLIAARRSVVAGGVAAALFAVSPILVTYGSEARGYAPMLLVFCLMVVGVDRWLDRPDAAPPTLGLTAAALVGVLAQLTMVFGLAALAGWVAMRRWREGGFRLALADTVRSMAVPLLTAGVAVLAIVRWLPGTGGFRVGSYQAFHLADLATGQGDLIAYTLGLSISHHPLTFVAVAGFAAVALLRLRAGHGWLFALAIAGLPIGIAVAAIGNAAIARYYLVGGVALLLLIAELAAPTLRSAGWRRVGAIIALALIVAGSLWRDAGLIGNGRADPAAAVATLRALAPRGTTVSLDRVRAGPVLQLAAAQVRYPLRLSKCGAFLFVDRDGSQPFPARPVLCGAAYAPTGAGAKVVGLSGTAWHLYRRL